jgi:hypothetical protein
MLLVLGISLMIWGIVSISTGKMTLTATKVVGPPAVYWLSILMIIALPINFVIGAIIGVRIGMAGGVLDRQTQINLTILEACITGGTFILVLILGAVLGVDPNELRRSRRRRDEDDFDDEDDDDRPRRRRRRDLDDEDDDRPRKRRRDEDDDDDRPRKRRRDEDDEDDRPRKRPKSEGKDDEGIAPGPPR